MEVFMLLPLSVCETNCYVVRTEKNSACLIDAPDSPDYILSELDRLGVTLKKILLTHGHCDHIAAAAALQDKTGCEVCVHPLDRKMLEGSKDNLADWIMGGKCQSVKSITEISDGDTITLDEVSFKVLHTPGHTRGSVCYICDDILFSGDTLFNMSIGRTDFPGGSFETLSKSLSKLRELDGDFTLLSGHGEESTLQYERKYNHYLREAK